MFVPFLFLPIIVKHAALCCNTYYLVGDFINSHLSENGICPMLPLIIGKKSNRIIVSQDPDAIPVFEELCAGGVVPGFFGREMCEALAIEAADISIVVARP